MFNIAVFVSGSGTNLQSIIDSINNKTISNAEIKLVISDKEDSFALIRAKNNNIPSYFINKKNYGYMIKKLLENKIDLIVLAGYLPIIPNEIINIFENKIINIHPSLIPSFCGKGFYGMKVHEAVFAAGVKITGATIHFVNSKVDGGSILIQEPTFIFEDDTITSIAQKVLLIEHKIIVEAIKAFTENRIIFKNNIAFVVQEK